LMMKKKKKGLISIDTIGVDKNGRKRKDVSFITRGMYKGEM